LKFTILGATGFIGRHLANSLRTAGHEILAHSRDDPGILTHKLGHVIYCIGMTADFRTRPFDTVRSHVSVLADVLEKADFDSLLYLSSTRVYARGTAGGESGPLVADVSDPSDLYNLTKLAGESLCRSCGRRGVKVARLSNVVGYDAQSELFLFALIREALAGRIELQTDPDSTKDYILLEDVVSLLPRIAVEGRDWLYNVASGVDIRHREIVERLAALTHCTWSVRPGAPLSHFPAIDITRLRAEFGFTPASVLEALPRLVEVFRINQAAN
jgi:nucleoside-diphosphate-sugar epimerase